MYGMKKMFLIISLVILVGCKKSGGDSEKPAISLDTPIANQLFAPGQLVSITGNITDNDELHEVHVIATNKTSGAEVVHLHEHVDAKSYKINQSFQVQTGVTYKIHIEAQDHVGNTSQVEIEVKGS